MALAFLSWYTQQGANTWLCLAEFKGE